jgi:two-component system, cell cycle response regulator
VSVVARILVVEDNRENLELMLLLLRAYGHEPIPATGGAKAIELAAADPPDVILLDIQMPDMDGFETAKLLRTNSALDDVPLVAVTALAMPGDREMILEAGFAGYIAKPIDAGRLPGQLAAFLGPSTR